MAQKTNLNISPYYDDFDSGKQFHKVLFNPGRSVQARELTTLQSILQDQIEKFGSHLFKEGSMVIPGGITFDSQFYSVKLNPLNFGTDITLYLNQLIGKKIRGQISGVTASVQFVELLNSESGYPTIYVKYLDSDNNFENNDFLDGEYLSCDSQIAYGNTTIDSGTPFSSTISLDATAIGSAASINSGVYFIRGYFVNVQKETILLDSYTNTPSYRVGLKVTEEIVSPKEDSSLFDNAKGFTNYSAPGADRFKVYTKLTKKPLTDLEDTDFIELLRVGDGKIKKIETKSQYSLIRDYIAERTYDESGDYVVDPFQISIHNSLNDRKGNDGLYFDTEKTDQNNTPSENLMCFKLSPGKAYVKGYDVEKLTTTIIDVEKPRTTQTVSATNVPFEMGNIIRVNNASGVAQNKVSISLYSKLKNSTTSPNGVKIGDARVYTFKVTDSAYSDSKTRWDLYLYDVQTYTNLTVNQQLSNLELPAGSFIKGKYSNASGYSVYSGSNSTLISLRQTSGSFIKNEPLIINGIENTKRTVTSIKVYSASDIKSVYQASDSGSGYPYAFLADVELNRKVPSGFSSLDKITIAADGTVTASGKYFTGISTDSIVRYQRPGLALETFNIVSSVASDGSSMKLTGISSVTNVFHGGLPTSELQTTFSVGVSEVKNQENASLYVKLPDLNVSSVNLSDSILPISSQITGEVTDGSGTLSFTDAQLGITSAFLEPFDVERYSIHYSDGTIAPLTADQFSLSNNTVTVVGLTPAESDIVVNTTSVKNGVKSKVKSFERSNVININYSKYPQSGTGISTSFNDGLTFNKYYGLRVQDEEICLNYPDVSGVLCVYESLNEGSPVLDSIQFNATANVDTNVIIGEEFIGSSSGAIARVVTKPTTNTLGIVYRNSSRFEVSENVTFKESNITTDIEAINIGSYKDVTNNFTLNKGQKKQYYDYSRIIRNKGSQEPSKKLLVVIDRYSVPSNDDGDLFTVLSYPKERYSEDIPTIEEANEEVRCSDVLDFRPRVSTFTPSSASASPFDFSSRSFGTDPKYIIAPNESAFVGYDFYLGRIDRVYLDKNGSLLVDTGIPSTDPKAPSKVDDVMDIATITLPPYLYSVSEVTISPVDNRRYTMRDIGRIEDRVETLEEITSLSLLEVSTQTLQVQDADGLNRFKSGFFVDDFKSTDFIDARYSSIQVDTQEGVLKPIVSRNTLKSQIAPKDYLTDENLDLSVDFDLVDSNLKKSDQIITLNYDESGWIEQPLATRVENVNPFHVIQYTGTIKLQPSSDNWVRTIRLADRTISRTTRTGSGAAVRRSSSVSTRDVLVSSGRDFYMRSRNVQFTGTNFKPLTRLYQFFDGNSGVDFIPKLIEIAVDSTLNTYGSNGIFEVGETVHGISNDNVRIRFRVATSNHKFGPFNNPTTTYNINPYVKTENITPSYNGSSKVLNVDTFGLSEEAQGKYYGYIQKGMKLVGQTSGTVAYVKDLRLVSDNYGDLIGSFFLRDPNSIPAPTVRFESGTKTYKLTSSKTNATPLPGSKLITFGETVYRAEGVLETRQLNRTVTTLEQFYDPLAQSFTVGNNVGEGNVNGSNDDANGCFLTSVDLFFASKDSGTAPLTVEVRTVEFGTPTRTVLGKPKTLRPEEISVSATGETATNVKFDYPIYLAPGQQYAIVLLAPETDQYEVWIAEMGENTVNTNSLPNAESVRYTRQFAIGRLYKSQNGAEWTPNDYQDMKFKLYKANFTADEGTAVFYNPSLDTSNGFISKLDDNPVQSRSRKITVGIVTTTNSTMIGILTEGRKVSNSTKTFNYGYIVGTGSSVSTVGVTTTGSNYAGSSQSNVETFPITGSGSGLILNLTISSGSVTGATVAQPGNGYSVGDVVGLVTSTAGNRGTGANVTITGITGLDTLYLDNVQGESFTVGSSLQYFNDSDVRVSLASTTIRSSSSIGGVDSGNLLRVNHFNHGMYSSSNKVTISDVKSSEAPTTLTVPLLTGDTLISVGSTLLYPLFEGIGVGATNLGYIKIEDEILAYESVGNGTIEAIRRGQDGTVAVDHPTGSVVTKYELNGVSLRRINTTHDISNVGIDFDGYYVEFDRSQGGSDRSSDGSLSGTPQLSFSKTQSSGGNQVLATENIQYDTVIPTYNIQTPGSQTSVTASIRTISGTSVDGTETSFEDVGFEEVQLNGPNKLSSTRLVCSKINETTHLGSLPRNKSFTTNLVLKTSDRNLSPIIFADTAFTEFRGNILNRPVLDYVNTSSTNSLTDDQHISVYVSNEIRLKNPANSLKVILSANKPSSTDIRVLYSLIKADSSEVEQSFELFPGYDNLTTDLDQDGYLDVVDPNKNSGRSDVFVPNSVNGQYLEHEYTASDLGSFVGYRIKIVMSGTDQSNPPSIKDLRTIALV